MPANRQPDWFIKLAVLLVLSSVLLFTGLGDMGLTDRDEGRNAEAGREMFASGDLITPTFNGELRVAKPVFIYWLMTLSYHAFGVNEFAARFPSALFGVALVLMHFQCLSRLRGPTAGFAGALMLLLNIEMLALGRMAITDSVLIFFTTLSLYSFWFGLHESGVGRHWMWGFYVGMAVATLTKGPVGFLIPLLTVGLYLTAMRRWSIFWQRGFPIAGTAVLLLMAAPWYLAMFLLHGDAYGSQAKAHTLGRFLAPMEGHGGGVWFYVPVLLLGFYPWSLFLPAAFYRAYSSWRDSRRTAPPDPLRSSHSQQLAQTGDELEWFAGLWFVGTFVFFTLSATRLPHYIGPLFPAASLLASSYWSRALQDPTTKGIRSAIYAILAVGYFLAIVLAALPVLYGKFAGALVKEFPLAAQFDLGMGPYLAAAVLLVGMGIVGYFGLDEERRWATLGVAGGVVAAVFLLALYTVIPGINRYAIAPPQELAYIAGLNLAPSDQFIVFGTTRPSLAFYSRHKVLFIPTGEADRLKTALKTPGKTMLLLQESMQELLPKEAAPLRPILKRYGYVLLASQPMVSVPDSATIPHITIPKIPGH